MKSSHLSLLFVAVLLATGCLFEDEKTMKLSDIDGDGVPDLKDVFPENPLEWKDNDSDGIGDNTDNDDDNDGYNDTVEKELSTNPLDNQSTPNDFDKDYIPDAWDLDDDNDCYDDEMEKYEGTNPFNNNSRPPDNDLDCISDGIDWDDDNDSVGDEADAFPFDPAASADEDGDGMPDWWRTGYNPVISITGLRLDPYPDDYDNDAVIDSEDAFPKDPAASIDSDSDGYPDRWNLEYGPNDSTTGLKLDQFPNTSKLHSWWQVALFILVTILILYLWSHKDDDWIEDGWNDTKNYFDHSTKHSKTDESSDYNEYEDSFDYGKCAYCELGLNSHGECPNFDKEHAEFFSQYTDQEESQEYENPYAEWTEEQLKALDKALKLKYLYDDAKNDDSLEAKNEAEAAYGRFTELLGKVNLTLRDFDKYICAMEGIA